MQVEKQKVDVGQEFYGILAELFLDTKTKRRRVRTTPGQYVPENILIECSSSTRERHPIGTIFKVDIAISRKQGGRIYAHAKSKSELLTISEWDAKYG